MALTGLGEAHGELLPRLAGGEERVETLLEAGLAVAGLAAVGEPQGPRVVSFSRASHSRVSVSSSGLPSRPLAEIT